MTPTTLVLVRHGVTLHTTGRRFSGGLGGDNPGLSEEGRAQAVATGQWLAATADGIDAVVCSPVRRTRESAELLADALGGVALTEEPGFAEMEFGEWDGLTFEDVSQRDKERFESWLGDMEATPPGGESFVAVEARVLDGLDRLLADHDGGTVVVVSHVTPIKTVVAHAMGAPLDAVFRMQLAPASVSAVSFFADHHGVRRGALTLFNALPPGDRSPLTASGW